MHNCSCLISCTSAQSSFCCYVCQVLLASFPNGPTSPLLHLLQFKFTFAVEFFIATRETKWKAILLPIPICVCGLMQASSVRFYSHCPCLHCKVKNGLPAALGHLSSISAGYFQVLALQLLRLRTRVLCRGLKMSLGGLSTHSCSAHPGHMVS